MARLPGPGPVFVYEWIIGARRWQVYATRTVFVAALLFGLGAVWESQTNWLLPVNKTQNRFAEKAFRTIVGTQLVLVMLAAPAATAGAICLDKARGTLAHVLVTDLTDAEIVLGKLAARLVPVLMFIGCSLPVLYLCTLLGGIDPNALPGAYAVTVAMAILGCSFALTLSIWARKTHEVLLATYLVWAAWLLANPAAQLVSGAFAGLNLTPWLVPFDPFSLAFATYGRPGAGSVGGAIAEFVAACLGCSIVLLALAIARVRRASAREAGRPKSWNRRTLLEWAHIRRDTLLGRLLGWMPGPSLDGNPVLWREWRRNRATGWAWLIWMVYGAGALAFTLIALCLEARGGRGRISLWV